MNPATVLGIIVTLFEETQRLSALAQELEAKLSECQKATESVSTDQSVDG